MKKLLVLSGVLMCLQCVGQTQVDSLQKVLHSNELKGDIEGQYIILSNLVNSSPQVTKKSAMRLFSEFEKQQNNTGMAMALHFVGASFSILSQTDSAITFFERALSYTSALEEKIHEGRIIAALSGVYIREYQLSKAQQVLQRGIDIARVINNRNLETTCLMNLAIVYTYLKDEESADSNLKKALEISLDLGNELRTGQIYGNLGNLEFERANYSLSYDYFQKALKKFEKAGVFQMSSVVYTQLGRSSSKLGDLNNALDYYDRALAIRKESGNNRGVLSVLRYKAQTLLDLRRFKESSELLSSIQNTADEINDPFILMDVAEIRYQLAEINQDYPSALAYFKQYNIHKDTVDARAQKEAVKRQTAEFDYAQLNLQLEKERQLNEIAELKRLRQGLIIVLLVVIVIASTIVYVVNRSRLKKALIINEKDKQLLNQKVESQATQINEFESELLKLEGQYSASAENKEKLIEILSGSKIEPKDWASFTILFEKIYPGVLQSFQEYNLTLNDQRLMAQIILGLTTKEMSSVLNITPKSVSKAKARLSTKLGISNTRELEQFIIDQIKKSD